MSLISTAQAATETAGAAGHHGPSMAPMLIVLAVILVFYFWMWRNQGKKTKERQRVLDGVAKGDEVLTSGGIAGKVVSIDDAYVRVLIAKDVEVSMQKGAIASVLPKGTVKHL